MKPVVGLALVVILILALTGCTLPGAATPTATLPPFPPVSSKAPPVNTLPPLPTFTGQPPRLATATPTQSPTQPVPKSTQVAGTPSGAGSPSPSPNPTTAPTVAPSATKAAPTLPAATATPPPPTKAPTAQPSATKAPTTTGSTAKDTRIFLVAIGDNGAAGKKIGCGDSVVGAVIQLADPAAPLRGALDRLLALKTQTYGQSGLYNALFRSDLKISSVIITNGVAEIKLTGALTLGGVCDAPRVQAQLEETALQFSTVQKVSIWINGVPLQNLLSQK